MGKALVALRFLPVHSSFWTSKISGWGRVVWRRFWRRWGERTELNQVVPRQTALGILEGKGRVDSREVMREAAWGRERMKGRGQDQKEKWGIRKRRCWVLVGEGDLGGKMGEEAGRE